MPENGPSREELQARIDELEERLTRVDEMSAELEEMRAWMRDFMAGNDPGSKEEPPRRHLRVVPPLAAAGALATGAARQMRNHPNVTAGVMLVTGGALLALQVLGPPPYDFDSAVPHPQPPVTLPSAPPPSPVAPSPPPDKPESSPSPDETRDDSGTMTEGDQGGPAPEGSATSAPPGPVAGDDTQPQEPEPPGEADDEEPPEPPSPDPPEPPDGGDADDGGNGGDSDDRGGGEDQPRRERCLLRVDAKPLASLKVLCDG